jgi:hypothetical protein
MAAQKPMTNPEITAPAPQPTLEAALDSLTNPTVLAYFDCFNAADFAATANLFAVDGQLLPPFESPIEGREAIAAYLATEAKGMKAMPQEASEQLLPSGETQVQVVGQVQTPLFSVNVGWQFVLNSDSKIVSVQIKLLAALRDLLHLKR